jgi:hypothetical protein
MIAISRKCSVKAIAIGAYLQQICEIVCSFGLKKALKIFGYDTGTSKSGVGN